MRGFDDDAGVECVRFTVTPAKTINYSDDEILQESALFADDVVCADGNVAAAPRRKSADYGLCFAPYSRLDVEHHPVNVHRCDDDDDERQIDCGTATSRSYQRGNASSHVDDGHFRRTTTHAAYRSATADSVSAAAAWPRDTVHHDGDDVTWWGGDRAAVSCRRRFFDKQLTHYERRGASSATAAASRLPTSCVQSVSDHTEFVVRRHDADLSSTTSSSSSSSPATQLLGRLAAQSSSPVADVIPPSDRLPPTSLRARKREQSTRSRSAAAGRLRRSNSVAGSSAGRPLHSADEGFADGRTRTPEPRRMSGSERHVGDTCCLCRDANARQVAASQSNVSSTSDQARKRSYRVGLNIFNKNPEQGIEYLRARQFLDGRPGPTAKFLIARKGLSKQMVGEYLGGLPTPFLVQVLRSFAQQIDLSGMHVDVALRKFQTYFRMPGEAQKIERIIEAFSYQYCACNPNVLRHFRSPDTVFLLAFAVMMLNTDLHNKNVRADKKMKVEDFVRNLRGIDGGSDVDPCLLMDIYERIKMTKFQPGEDHVTQVMRVEQMLVGKKPRLSDAQNRRLVCYCRLQEVVDPAHRQRVTQHHREVFLFNDVLLVAKIVNRNKGALTYSYRQCLSLKAMGVYLFESAYYRYGICLTNTQNNKVLIMLTARNEHDRKNFIDDLRETILENNATEFVESEAGSVGRATSEQLKLFNVNRYSNDSGVVDVDLRSLEVTEIHRFPADGNGQPRPQSVHNSSAGSNRGSAVSLENQGISIRAQQGEHVGTVQLH